MSNSVDKKGSGKGVGDARIVGVWSGVDIREIVSAGEGLDRGDTDPRLQLTRNERKIRKTSICLPIILSRMETW
jgi:hypothetical protein